jgi:hypothetical protein
MIMGSFGIFINIYDWIIFLNEIFAMHGAQQKTPLFSEVSYVYITYLTGNCYFTLSTIA